MALDLNHFKQKLLKEKETLESELSRVARRDDANPSNWDPVSSSTEGSQADENLAADNIEDYEENMAITNSLESRLQDVEGALDKIAKGGYGVCQVCNKEIEKDRLEANPAARTCKEHIDSL